MMVDLQASKKGRNGMPETAWRCGKILNLSSNEMNNQSQQGRSDKHRESVVFRYQRCRPFLLHQLLGLAVPILCPNG